jgi:hypothetical protein
LPLQDRDDRDEFVGNGPRPAAGIAGDAATEPRRRNLFEFLFGSRG